MSLKSGSSTIICQLYHSPSPFTNSRQHLTGMQLLKDFYLSFSFSVVTLVCLEQRRTLEWLCFPPVRRSAAPSASPSGGNRGAEWPGSDTRWSWAPSSPKWHPRLPAGSEGTKTQEECCRLSDRHSCTPALQRHYCCSAKVRIYPKLHNKDLSKSALRPWTGRETHLPRLANHQKRTGDIL